MNKIKTTLRNISPGFKKGKQANRKTGQQGFTLVELIIVIAIIAVLAVAAFMMLTKWLGHSRDARKIGDMATIKKALNIAFVEKPIYPEPTDKSPIKDLNGNVLWYQGVFGLASANGIDTLQKAPKNPTDDGYYLYSVTNDQKEYQIGVWLENGEEVSFTNSVFAVEGFARIEGEYDGYVTYSSGSDGKIIKIPSLILTDGDAIDISGSNTNLMLEGKSEGEPFEVKNVAFNPENVDNNKLINDVKSTFGMEDDKAAMLVIEDNSSITPSAIIYAGCDSDIRTINGRVYNVPAMSHGGSKAVNVEDGSFTNGTKYWTVTFSCNAETLSESTETEVINCTDGFVESNGACELDKCDGDIPDNAESNATSTGIGTTRNYTTTPGKCTYECKDGFHTEDGGTSCIDSTKTSNCDGTLPNSAERNTSSTYTQTWNGTDWGTTKSANYNTTSSTEDCRFKCSTGRVYSNGSCVINIAGDDTNGRKWSDGTYATSCDGYKNNLPSGYIYSGVTGDGIYLIKPNSNAAFKAYCDMTTDNGGWTLVWSQLRGKTGRPTTSMTWANATGKTVFSNGTLSNDKETFEVYHGLSLWNDIMGNTSGEIRYEWRYNFGVAKTQEFQANLGLFSSSNNYTISMSNYVQKVGAVQAGLYVYHNGRPFSAYNDDNDGYSVNCSSIYSYTPWWYGSCWNGNINGGGEYSGSSYVNGAYWNSSAQIWGTTAGEGGGNGWIFIR